MKHLEQFSVPSQTDPLETVFIETMQVTQGVTCDVYSHPETELRDLGIILIQAGKSTPLQEVLTGEETIEVYLSGRGVLVIHHIDGTTSEHEVDEDATGFAHIVDIGEKMQWRAAEDSELIVAEVCFPPYQEGRFRNLTI